jgi:hypothetical protein
MVLARTRLLVALGLLLVGSGVGTASAACTDAATALADSKVEFEGRAGKEQVRLYLTFDTADESGRAVEGVASVSRNHPVETLAGHVGPDCVLTVSNDEQAASRTTWTLRYRTPSTLSGRYQRTGLPSVPVELRAVTPTSCDAPGRWKTFRSPDWPMTFDYPESWLLDARVGWIGLSCRSLLSQMRGWDSLAMTEGLGAGDLDDIPGIGWIRTVKDFRTVNGRDWMIGAFCPQRSGGVDGPSGCQPARQTVAHGMTLLQGRVERSRVTALHYLLVLPNRWVALETYDNMDRLEGGGEVLFGDDIVSRVVRSMRPVAPAR